MGNLNEFEWHTDIQGPIAKFQVPISIGLEHLNAVVGKGTHRNLAKEGCVDAVTGKKPAYVS